MNKFMKKNMNKREGLTSKEKSIRTLESMALDLEVHQVVELLLTGD